MKIIIKPISQIIICGALLLYGSGCSEFLEETDPSNLTMDNYFTKSEHAESIVNAIYSSLVNMTVGGNDGACWEIMEFATGLADAESGEAFNNIIVKRLINTSDNIHCLTWWTSQYRGIQNANLAIAKIPGITMDETKKNKFLGEARFLRAYYYFNLVRIFGKVPLITEIIDLGSPNLYPPQSSEEDIYKLIVEDLIVAENSGLPNTDVSGRISLGAVKSLLAKVYLTMAGFPLQKGTEYYQKAADKANEVIMSNIFSLFTSYDDLHDPVQNNKGENIFMVQFASLISPNSFTSQILPYYKDISAYSQEHGAIYATNAFIGTYETEDKRIKEKQFYFRKYTRFLNRMDTINLGFYYLYKHFDIAAHLTTASSGLNWRIMRYAEVLLIYAEAVNEVSGPSSAAYEAINKIRKRAEVPELSGLSKEQFRNAVWMERWHELSYENVTWFDMARLRKTLNETTLQFEDFIGHKFSYGPILQAKDLLFPIPTVEIMSNINLIQNTGY